MGAFGDIFVQVYAGVAKSLRPTVKSLRTFLKANREIIGTKIVEFLVKLSTTFLNVLGPAVNMAYKIFSGFKNILTLGEAAVAGYTSVIEDLYSAIASEQAIYAYQQLYDQEEKIRDIRKERTKVFREAGTRDTEQFKRLTAELEQEMKKRDALKFTYEKQQLAAENAKASADKASKASQRAQAAAAKEILQQEKNVKELEKTIERVTKAIESGINKVALSALAELRKEVKSYATTQEEADKKKAEADKKKAEAAKKAVELARKRHEEEMKRLEAERAMQAQIGGIIGGQVAGSIKSVVQGTKSASEAMKDFAIQTAQAVIKATILAGIQTAVKAGTMSAFGGGLFSSLAGGLLSFNNGGYVPGFNSGGGVDSVAARLTPGEFVLPKGIVDSIRLGKAPPKAAYANGGMVQAGAQLPNNQPINIQMQTFAVPSRGQFRRWYKSSVSPNVASLRQRGQV